MTNDPWVAWCINEAVFMFGRHVENAVESAGKGMTKPAQVSAARQRALSNVLGGGVKQQGQFRDPAAMT